MGNGQHSLAQLIDLPRLQRVCDGISSTSGAGLAVLDPDGRILASAGWQDICSRFHRKDAAASLACSESDRRINERLAGEPDAPTYIAYKCANGLWDVAFPLILEGDHIATVFTGQFFYDDDHVDPEEFRMQARRYGFDEEAYLEALARVPMLTHAHVEQTIAFLADLVGMLSELGLNAVRHERDHAALVASEQEYRGLAEDMPALVCTTDAAGVITYMNAAAAASMGREKGELVGRDVLTLLDPEARQLVARARGQLTPEQPVETHEELLEMPDGARRWFEWTNRGFFDDDGLLLRVQALGRDVHERRIAAQTLVDSERRLRLAHVAANDVVWDWDAATDTQRWILEGKTVFGWSVPGDEAFPAAWWEERIHDDDRGRVVKGFSAAVEDQAVGSWRADYRFRCPDGTYVQVEDRASVFRDDDETATRVVGVMLDISERREAEEELRRSQRQYETFINATTDMAFLKDGELSYAIVNKANADFFGLAVDEVVGKTDDELMEPTAAEACRTSDLNALRTGALVVTMEEQGDRVYETRKFPVTLTDGTIGVGGYVRDVTEQQHAEAEILRLADDLERRVAQRTAQLEATNRELESFAYSISHDLRAPLRALDGFSEILLQDYGDALDEAGRGHLGRIKGAANHMAGLMDGLLQLSRLNRDELDLQPVDLSELAAAVAAELRESDPERDVDVRIEPGVSATADPKLARAVVANLIGNAWKFTSRHDRARIEFGVEPASEGRAGAVFFVRDDGAGFDMRYAENLFGAFQRLHTPDQFEGTGIGLATVQRILHRHGGAVWATGEIERGATFWFTFAPG